MDAAPPAEPALDRTATCDVVLVLMPYARLEHPSIGLGLLKAALTRAGLSSTVLYANLLFAEEVGIDLVQLINHGSRGDLNGEWTFAGAAFPEHVQDHSFHLSRAAQAFSQATRSPLPKADVERIVLDRLHALHALAPSFVDRVARRVLASGPRIVGVSSTFEQHVASLALLRRIRELAPDVVTLIGGANCEAEMGVATVREFPWVDIAFSGEADDAIGPLCKTLLRHGRDAPSEALPTGAIDRTRAEALTHEGRTVGIPPRCSVLELDPLPTPDFDDYFETLERMNFGDQVLPGLQLETSRGCWWGAIKHCTFCGLNGGNMAFRAKSPERVLQEIDELSERHGLRKFAVVDNILDMNYVETVLPRLAERGDYRFFYETKANLRREQVRLLRDAGVLWIQPGIESLHDELLKLMDKGCSALTNIQLLKYAREFGLYVVWNFLGGFPGENDAWHAETADLLPLLHHLPPPHKAFRVRFDRFSVYQREPERFGLRLVPFDSYRDVFPVSPEGLADLAYFLKDAGDAHETHDSLRIETVEPPGIAALQEAVRVWQKAAGHFEPALLTMDDEGDAVTLFDTRPCAPERRVRLEGLSAELYRRMEPSLPRARLVASVCEGSGAPAQDVERRIDELRERKLLVEIRGRVLALAIPGDVPGALPAREFPGGHTQVARPSRIAERPVPIS